MKIIYLHQYFNTPAKNSGSFGTRSYDIAKRLVQLGHEVHVITSKQDGNKSEKMQWETTNEESITVHWFPVTYSNSLSFFKRIVSFLKFAFLSARKTASLEGDVIFATSTPLTIALPAIYASKRNRIPMVFELRDLWPDVPIAMGILKNPLVIFLAKRLERFAYNNATHIIAFTPRMEKMVLKKGYSSSQISVIPNGSDVEFFESHSDRNELFFETYPFLKDRTFVLYSGILGSYNNVDFLLKIAKEMKEEFPEIYFVIVGDGKNKEYLLDLAKSLGVYKKNVWILPPVSKLEIRNFYFAATATASLVIDMIAHSDNFGNKVFDSFACGKPVIINHHGWLEQVLNESKAGLMLYPDNVKESSKLLAKHLCDKNWLLQASVAAKNLGVNRFSRAGIAKNIEKVLMDAVNHY